MCLNFEILVKFKKNSDLTHLWLYLIFLSVINLFYFLFFSLSQIFAQMLQENFLRSGMYGLKYWNKKKMWPLISVL